MGWSKFLWHAQGTATPGLSDESSKASKQMTQVGASRSVRMGGGGGVVVGSTAVGRAIEGPTRISPSELASRPLSEAQGLTGSSFSSS